MSQLVPSVRIVVVLGLLAALFGFADAASAQSNSNQLEGCAIGGQYTNYKPDAPGSFTVPIEALGYNSEGNYFYWNAGALDIRITKKNATAGTWEMFTSAMDDANGADGVVVDHDKNGKITNVNHY